MAWLRGLVTGWSAPRRGTPSPLTAAVTAPGGSALLSLTAWGLQHVGQGQAGEELPEPLTATLEELLGAAPDDQVLAVIGFCLAQLHRGAPAWTADQADALLSLDHAWRPARVWLTGGHPDAALLARLERTGLCRALCVPGAEGALDRSSSRCWTTPNPSALQGSSSLISPAARAGPRPSARCCPGWPPTPPRHAARWPNGLLPCGGPHWRPACLPRPCAEQATSPSSTSSTRTPGWSSPPPPSPQQPDLEDADQTTERAARSPHSPAAQLISAAALDHGPLDGYRRTRTVRHAAALYAGSPVQDTPERIALRTALINAGVIDDAYRN
ncbi:hypothetical protein AB0O01_00035 [Streptomyces sp. NPDC093252]|uniref:hypothetical protein n=1 Tax=Streptomyces sp. NPDC093252 TaxID=3154980 RepID=UPI00342F47D8